MIVTNVSFPHTPRQCPGAHHSEVRRGMRGLTVEGDKARSAARGGVGTWK
jgi:hypothetical protein